MATSPTYAQNVWTGGKFSLPGTKAPAADPEAGAFLKLGFGLLLLDTFLNVSRSLEIVSLNSSLSFPLVATVIHAIAFGLAFITGGARRIATSRIGLLLLLFTGWMMACAPFSAWRTGSAQTILYNWTPSLAAFLASGLLYSQRQCRRFAAVLALSALGIALASFFLGTTVQGRFAFPGGTLGNANDLAMLLLLGAPFFFVPLLDSSSSRVIQFLALPASLLVIGVSFRTGSRAGLLAVFAIVGVLFLTRSLIGKLKLAGALIALAAGLVAFIPSYSLYRYATIFNDSSTKDARTDETYGSSELRKVLLQESLMTTFEHPLFGVGPGVFAPAAAKEALQQGRNANWRVSHNTYTQVSSEMGIPGLILYLAIFICAYTDLVWVRKHSPKDSSTNAVALCTLLSLAGLNMNFFFGSNAYMAWVPIVLGLAAALRLNVQRDLEASTGVPATTSVKAGASASQKSGSSAQTPAVNPAADYHYRFLGRPRKIRP
jgi:O-antigen ligase